jgi:hypothetical protein
MKKFIIKILCFIGLLILWIILSLFLPTTPRVSKSLLFADIKKDSLLINVPSPRIIFVGGSNLSFGLNSQIVKDSLHINPINTAIHAGIGVKYMLDNTYQYVKYGDIVVLALEYYHFSIEYCSSSEELLRIVLDVNKSKIRLLNSRQIINCIPYIGKYILSKYNVFDYLYVEESDIYGVNSFNDYGDVYTHRDLNRREFILNPDSIVRLNYNYAVMDEIKKFEEKLFQKGAVLYISYPAILDISFHNEKLLIDKVEDEYIKYDFTILGTPSRYMFSDSLIFNTDYHLSGKGADYRTQLLIEDLKKVLPSN